MRIVKFLSCVVILGSLLLIPQNLKRLTSGFKLAKMEAFTRYSMSYEEPNTDNYNFYRSILQGHFRYLGKGAQCYVFEDETKNYVLKIFRFHAKNIFFQPEYQKIQKLKNSLTIADQCLKSETGILFLHLNKTWDKFPDFKASSPLGFLFNLRLDDCCFCLQKKVGRFDEVFLEAYRNKDQSAICKQIDSFLTFTNMMIDKKIQNLDMDISGNFGLDGENFVAIDVGNFSFLSQNFEAEKEQYLKNFKVWLQKNAPEYIPYFDEKISSLP